MTSDCGSGRLNTATKNAFTAVLKSSRIMYSAGTRISVIIVANRTPNANDTAIGIRKRACRLFSSIIGTSPQKVVSVVSRIGRKRRVTESRITCFRAMPSARSRLIRSIMISESLTTIPVSATIPNTDRIDNWKPMKICPASAPTNPKGIADMMIAGCI